MLILAVMLAALVTVGALIGRHRRSPAQPASAPPRSHRSDPPPAGKWLGLDYNSSSDLKGLAAFARHGIVYDREGGLEVVAGQTAAPGTPLARSLDVTYATGMIPDIEVDPRLAPRGCTGDPQTVKLCLPTSSAQIASYARGFTRTATSVRQAFPRRRMLFEPMNEPWNWAAPPGTEPGASAAAEYARVLAETLRALRLAGGPLSDVYVPATGALADGSSWIPDLYSSAPCLAPGPQSCGPIEGWTIHPYGRPRSATQGIDSVRVLRGAMRSGQSNIIVSEIGFCATDVDRGAGCAENLADVVGTSLQAARWLTETLDEASQMHRAGWLRAVIVWERGGGGWAMENPDGRLTAQGRALELSADSLLDR